MLDSNSWCCISQWFILVSGLKYEDGSLVHFVQWFTLLGHFDSAFVDGFVKKDVVEMKCRWSSQSLLIMVPTLIDQRDSVQCPASAEKTAHYCLARTEPVQAPEWLVTKKEIVYQLPHDNWEGELQMIPFQLTAKVLKVGTFSEKAFWQFVTVLTI